MSIGVSSAGSSSAPGTSNPTLANEPEGDALLIKEAQERKRNSDKWEGMLANRAARIGLTASGTVSMKALFRKGGVAKDTVAEKVSYPEDDVLGDDTGLQKEKKKVAKRLKKDAKKGEAGNAEDDAVPQTANSLLSLKSEIGEGVWDFEDGEAHSDDEADEIPAGMDRKKEEDLDSHLAPEADDEFDDPEGVLSKHGKDLERLLEKQSDLEEPTATEAGEGDDAISEGEQCAKRRRMVESVDEKRAGISAVETEKPPLLSASSMVEQPKKEQTPKRPPEVAQVSNPPAVQKAAPARQKQLQTGNAARAELHELSDEQLKRKIVNGMREKNNQWSLQDLAQGLGLKQKSSELYKRAIAMIKTVATMQKVEGHDRPVLILNPEHRLKLS